jgi:hypothetical protein
MSTRTIAGHTWFKLSAGRYELRRGAVVLTLERHERTGGNNFRWWEMLVNGETLRSWNDREAYIFPSLSSVAYCLERIGACADCGAVRPRLLDGPDRCPQCAAAHAELTDGYKRGLHAVARTERVFALAERIATCTDPLTLAQELTP